MFLKHVAERIQQEVNENEKERVQECERGEAHAWVNDDAENFERGFGGTLQNLPRVETRESTDVYPETAQR